ncbi:MAG: hypothetical protein LR011_11890 [Verrucomicrobia bacterium]|nr:hypothetical protein [Verrucomicrobiota bacterium]
MKINQALIWQVFRNFTLVGSITYLGLGGILGQGQFFDDFEDGNFEGWVLQNNLEVVGVQPSWTIVDGQVDMMCPPPPVPNAGPARAFMYLPDKNYSNVYAAVDVLNWNNNINQAFGIFIRMENVGLGQTTGYIVNYNPNQTGSVPWGQFQINRVIGEAVPSGNTLAIDSMELEPNADYRMVAIALEGKIIGLIYDLKDLTRPISRIETATGDDRVFTYEQGSVGLFNFYRSNDVTASHAVSQTNWDNFYVSDISPEFEPAPWIVSNIPGKPGAIELTPQSGAYLAGNMSSISALIQTDATHPVVADDITLQLNGQAIHDFTWSPMEDNRFLLSAPDTLKANQIYSAQLNLPTTGGISTTVIWNFDTFSNAYLDSQDVILVECEDFNFGGMCDPQLLESPESGGQFIDNPPVSGLDEFSNPIPADGSGYVLKAGLLNVDYFDFDTTLVDTSDSIYRLCDPVGTRDSLDSSREDYMAADISEQDVFRIESGEWLNYTRTFKNPSRFHVYLRTSSLASQSVTFSEITSDPLTQDPILTPRGTFQVPNLTSSRHYQFVPLTRDDGQPATVEWTSELDAATLPFSFRLNFNGSEPQEFLKKFTLFPNYLVFVPATNPVDPTPAQLSYSVLRGSEPNTLAITLSSDKPTQVTIQQSPSISTPQWGSGQTVQVTPEPQSIILTVPEAVAFFRFIQN